MNNMADDFQRLLYDFHGISGVFTFKHPCEGIACEICYNAIRDFFNNSNPHETEREFWCYDCDTYVTVTRPDGDWVSKVTCIVCEENLADSNGT